MVLAYNKSIYATGRTGPGSKRKKLLAYNKQDVRKLPQNDVVKFRRSQNRRMTARTTLKAGP